LQPRRGNLENDDHVLPADDFIDLGGWCAKRGCHLRPGSSAGSPEKRFRPHEHGMRTGGDVRTANLRSQQSGVRVFWTPL
jgi:hypothetical protein